MKNDLYYSFEEETDNDWGFFIDLDLETDVYETTFYENIDIDIDIYDYKTSSDVSGRTYYENIYSYSFDSIYYEPTLYENIDTESSGTIHYENIHTESDTCSLFNEIKQLFKYVTTTICISGVIIYNYFITNTVRVSCC